MRTQSSPGTWIAALAVALPLALAGGCDRGQEAAKSGQTEKDAASASSGAAEAAKVTITASARKEATEIFNTRCAACHGLQGRGDGPGSAGLSPKPRNFADKHWQESVSDSHIETIIVYGGAAVGKSPAMPGNPDLKSKPAVVAALREYIRGLGK